MTARDTMTTLIALTRSLIGDTGGTAVQHYTDDNIQTALDATREYAVFEKLEAIPTPTAVGYDYLHYRGRKYFDSGGTIQDYLYQGSMPGTLGVTDWVNGRYEYTASQYPAPERYITGNRYDVYGASADLVDQWLASVKNSIDFQAGTTRFTQSQLVKNLADLAARLRGQSERGGTNTVWMSRGDMDYT